MPRWLVAPLVIALLAAPQGLPAAKPLTVSAAISLAESLSAAAEAYGGHGHGTVRFNFAASNILARQIVNGAPVDVFISADQAQMDTVAAAGLIAEGSRVDLLRNQLALVVPSDRPRTMSSMRDLTGPAFRRIAIGDPAAVPAGGYAQGQPPQQKLWGGLPPQPVPAGGGRA